MPSTIQPPKPEAIQVHTPRPHPSAQPPAVAVRRTQQPGKAAAAHGAASARPRPVQQHHSMLPLSGLSQAVKENAYLYWPKGRSTPLSSLRVEPQAGQKAENSPLQRLRLWTEAINNVASGNTTFDKSGVAAGMPLKDGTATAMRFCPAGAEQAQGACKDKEEQAGMCETCQSRTYQDGSNDAGVSFQSPKGIPASTAGVLVASHEGEHATRETAEAQKNGEVITGKKVTMRFGCCPECNKLYAMGGRTTITKVEKGGNAVASRMADMMGRTGESVDMAL